MRSFLVKLELSVEEINLILQGLGELPAKMSMAIIQKVQQQAASQMQPGEPEEGET